MTKLTRFLLNTLLALLIVGAGIGLSIFAYNAWIILILTGVIG